MRIDELNGQVVNEVSWKPPVSLRTGGGWVLSVDSEVTVTRADGDRFTSSGGDRAAPAAVAAELSGRIVDGAVIETPGEIRVDFEDGSQLVASPDPDAEAWRLEGPAGQQIACLPGGEISVHTATRPA
ncbi:MAG TPA: DUF6188 family protein [Glycomyces sp.]|nr:DUF6188 family protein [Glycomyces sp.]